MVSRSLRSPAPCSTAAPWSRAQLPSPPGTWTWDDALAWGKQVSRDADRDGVPDQFMFQPFAGRGDILFSAPFIYGNGGRLVSADGRRSAVAEPAAVEALTFLADLTLKHNIAPKPEQFAALGARTYADLENTQRGFVRITTTGSIAARNEPAGDGGYTWDLAPFPKAPRTGKAPLMVGATPYTLSATARFPDLAWEILKFMAGHEVETLLGHYQVTMPGLRSALLDPDGWLAAPPQSIKWHVEEVFRQSVPCPDWEGGAEYMTAIGDALDQGFQGKIGMNDACQLAAQAGDQVLRQQGRA